MQALGAASSFAELAAIVDVERWLTLLVSTAIVCVVAVATAVLLGGTWGALIARTDLPGRTLLMAGAALGACMPIYVSVVFIFALIPASALPSSAIVCGGLHGLLLAPLATVVLAVTFRAADRGLEEQALLDARRWSVLWRVTLPQAGWGIATLGVLVTLLVATDYTIADILMVRTFAEEIYTQYALDHARVGPLTTSVPVLLTLAVLLLVFVTRYRRRGEATVWHFGARPDTIRLGRWRGPIGIVALLVPVLLAGAPAVVLLRRIGSLRAFCSAAWPLRWELLGSTSLAVVGSLIIGSSAVGLAWFAVRGGRWRWVACGAVLLLLALPAPVVGISLIGMFNRPGCLWSVYDSPALVVVGYIVRFLPVAVVLLLPAVQRVPIELELAARIDGGDWLTIQRHVYWPAAAGAVVSAGLVVAILCFAEVGATVLLTPPDWPMVSVRAYTLLHSGVYRDLAVLAVLSVGCIVVPWLALALLLRRRLVSAAGVQ
ncbi:MAG: ABC transporter permease subunit [Planctomycetes bacterium]|nr:ABC transporter permease subunit [Planctomycetota bacterium]